MKQVIISEEASAYAAGTGKLVLQVMDSAGQPAVPADAAAVTAAGQFRIAREGATSDSAEKASPWLRHADILNVEFKEYSAGSPEVHTVAFVGSSVGETATLKIIMTTAGYEPFTRHNLEFVSGATAVASAAAALAAVPAAGFAGVASVAVGATAGTDDHKLIITLDSGERAVVAFDAGDSDIVATDVISGAVAEVGTAAMLRALELEEAGREDGNYDRLNPFAAEVATNVVAATQYDMISVTFRNSAEGQIRGVDNIRTINIAVTEEVDGEAKVSGLLAAIKG